jgi:hypothetical protein
MGLRHSPTLVTNGLVALWDAGNTRSYIGSGTTWNDLTGNNLTMTTVNSPTFSSGSFAFNGSTQYASATNSTLLDNQTFTVSVWVKTNATTQNGFWFEKGTVNAQYALFQEGTLIKCRINNGSGVIDTIAPVTASFMNTTSWFNVVFTFVTGSQVCYINSSVAGTGTTAATIPVNSGGMWIGVYGGTGGYYFNGSIAQVKIYNRALSAAEVRQNYNALRGRFGL